ncbi:putative membrane protein, partial [Vibrio parahaemolyticus V-223/04]
FFPIPSLSSAFCSRYMASAFFVNSPSSALMYSRFWYRYSVAFFITSHFIRHLFVSESFFLVSI